MSGPDLSVVIACVDARATVLGAIAAVRAACEGLAHEIILVDASTDGTADRVRAEAPDVRVLSSPPGAMVPELWGQGLAVASGRAVAFTIGQCRVGPGWARALLGAIAQGAAGAGGPIHPGPRASATDVGIVCTRYSAFLAADPSSEGPTREIAGDNAAYEGAALARHAGLFRYGFWEAEYHHALRAEGATLRWCPTAMAEFEGGGSPFSFVAQRFRHGRHFGAWRVSAAGQSRLRVFLAAPAVPIVMFGRIFRRLRGFGELRARFVAASPQVLLFLLAWALGEAAGAARRQHDGH